MIKGLALTPPSVGRITIGKVVERNGKRLPEKDDEFTLTSQVQTRDGWVLHPLNDTLRGQLKGKTKVTKANSTPAKTDPNAEPAATEPIEATQAHVKLRSIPVRLLFDDPDLNLRAHFTLFDRHTGRPMCVGNGETCKRAGIQGAETLECEGPDLCGYAQGNCKPFGRMNVHVGEEDELGTFVFRTTGFNSIRTLSTRLRYFAAVSGGMLSTLPLELRLRGKSTVKSHRAAIYYVDLTLRSGMSMVEALTSAKFDREVRLGAGWDQAALDSAAREGFAAGVFEESVEEGAAVVEEFYPIHSDETSEQDGLESTDDSLESKTGSTKRHHVYETLAGKLTARMDGVAAKSMRT
jgi:Recombination directionality factor-like